MRGSGLLRDLYCPTAVCMCVHLSVCVHLRAETISAVLSVEVICCTPTLKELLKYTDAGNKKHKINDTGTAFPSS